MNQPIDRDQRKSISQVREVVATMGEHQKKLLLLRTAMVMAMEGITRAQVSEVTSRVKEDNDIEVPSWEAGVLFSRLGFRTATSHGRNRLVLNLDHLKELHQSAKEEVEVFAANAQETLEGFESVDDQIKELESKARGIIAADERVKKIRQFMFKNQNIVMTANSLEGEYLHLKRQAEKVETLEAEIDKLKARQIDLPSLEDRRHQLEEKVQDYEVEEKALAKEEARLKTWIQNLQERRKWMTAAEQEEEVAKSRAELNQLREQLGEKRGLVAKLLGGGS